MYVVSFPEKLAETSLRFKLARFNLTSLKFRCRVVLPSLPTPKLTAFTYWLELRYLCVILLATTPADCPQCLVSAQTIIGKVETFNHNSVYIIGIFRVSKEKQKSPNHSRHAGLKAYFPHYSYVCTEALCGFAEDKKRKNK